MAVQPRTMYLHAKVHFKRFGVITIYLIFIYFSFKNIMNSVKQKDKSEFFQIGKRYSLDDFHKYIMSMGLNIGEKT